LWQAAARGEGAGLAGAGVICAEADEDSNSDAAIAAIGSRIANEHIGIGIDLLST